MGGEVIGVLILLAYLGGFLSGALCGFRHGKAVAWWDELVRW